jgi:hypothetical protein
MKLGLLIFLSPHGLHDFWKTMYVFVCLFCSACINVMYFYDLFHNLLSF